MWTEIKNVSQLQQLVSTILEQYDLLEISLPVKIAI